MLLFVYTTSRKRFLIFVCRYFKVSWNATFLSQSNCRNFSCSSIIVEIWLRNFDSSVHNSRQPSRQFLLQPLIHTFWVRISSWFWKESFVCYCDGIHSKSKAPLFLLTCSCWMSWKNVKRILLHFCHLKITNEKELKKLFFMYWTGRNADLWIKTFSKNSTHGGCASRCWREAF